jgi:PAS domain S-box-containing protein
MTMDISTDDMDKKKSREQLIRELAELRTKLAAEEKCCREMSLGLTRLKFTDLQEKKSFQFQQNMTGRKRTDDATSHQLELINSIINNIPILLVMWDPQLRRFTLNRCAENVIGWTTEEANEIDFMKEVYPDAAYRAEVETFMLSLESEWHEWQVKTKNGEYVPIDWTNIYLTDYTMIGIGVDLRERKQTEQMLRQSEERYRQLLTLLPAAMYTCDENGLITYYNEQAAKLWGRSPRMGNPDELFCGSFRFYCPDGSALTRHQTPIAKVLQDGNSVRGQEVNIERPDGERLCILVNIDPLRDENGRLCGAINVFTDITAHKRTEASLQRLNETLEQQVAERTEIAESRAKQLQVLTSELIEAEEKERQRIAMLLHDDLQQILVSAKFQTEMLIASLPDESIKKAETLLDILSKATESCRTLSHELNLTSMCNPNFGMTLKKIVDQMGKNHGLMIDSNIEFDSDQVSENIKFFIGRTVKELLFNCAKHAGSDRASLEICRQGNFLTIIFSDNGVGFDPDRLKIRGGNTGGIGLFGIQQRTEALGGSFKVESTPNKGSRFVLNVPFKKKYLEDDNKVSTSDMFKMLLDAYDLTKEV